MSQFNFPRINFHGSVYLDMPTANNGKFVPLTIYNQDEGLPYLPPRINLDPEQYNHVKQTWPGLPVVPEADGGYVQIEPISTAKIMQSWAQSPLGKWQPDPNEGSPDEAYHDLYKYVKIIDQQPGYWNYFGDMSIFSQDIQITGFQLHEAGNDVITYTPENSANCPAVVAAMLGGQLSFHEDFFSDNPRTSGVMVDVDSTGQTCTQMFINNAGVYSNEGGNNRTFFQGKPCKSTFSWMTLNNVLNWNDKHHTIVPMSGSASFYSTIALSECDPDLQALFNQYAGVEVNSLFMKILVHQVYETRNPDYSGMDTITIGNNRTAVPKNPAEVAFTGSICPWIPGDMKTSSICRILKNPASLQLKLNTESMLKPIPCNSKTELEIIDTMQFAPALLKADPQHKLVSVDLSNVISSVGTAFGEFKPWAGPTTVKPFTSFESYDFGTMTLNFLPDDPDVPSQKWEFDHNSYYNMANFLATGGMYDVQASDVNNYLKGEFYISIGGNKALVEDPYLITTDQRGTYAEQNQNPGEGYMNDGLPKEPIIIRAFRRGQPISTKSLVSGTKQTISMQEGTVSNKSVGIYDQMPFQYPTDTDGCMAYGFAIGASQELASDMSNALYWLTNGYFLTTRVLSAEPQLQPYLDGRSPITWDVIRDNVLANFSTVVPIMSFVLPFEEAVWSDPVMLRRIKMFTDEANWQEFMYMPITREMSATQRQVLHKWIDQKLANVQ